MRRRSRTISAAHRSTVQPTSMGLRSHKHKNVSCTTDHAGHDIGQARAFFRRKMQPQLCAPPEHIVRGLRPFPLDEIPHLGGREVRADAGPELLKAPCEPEDTIDARA